LYDIIKIILRIFYNIIFILYVDNIGKTATYKRRIQMDKLRICASIKHPPFEFINEKGVMEGFNIDITKSIAKEMGFDINIELLEWDDAIRKMERRECDAIQGMSISRERIEKYVFASEYITLFHSAIALIDRNDLNDLTDLKDYKVAVQENDGYELIKKIRSRGNNKSMLISTNHENNLRLLLSKEVDIVIGNKLTLLYYMDKLGIKGGFKLLGKPINITRYGIAFNKGNSNTAFKFKIGMDRIKANGVYESIYDKWFGQNIVYYGKQIIENVDTGVIYIDKLGRISAVNNFAEKLLHIDSKDLIFKSFYETEIANIFNINIIQGILDYYQDAYYGKIKINIDNIYYYLEVNYIKLLDKKNELMGVLINFKDITEKTKLEEFLIRKDKMESLGFLLLNVAHELRNPLTSIKNFTELMPEHIHEEEFRESLLYHVPKQVDYINKLVSNLLEYSKPKEAELTRINVKQFFDNELLSLFYKLIKSEKNITFCIDIAEEFSIIADPNQLKQVLINLIQNASDSIKESGIIKIYSFENKDTKVIAIEDDGEPIAESDLSKVFDPFFTTKPSGTGLGLFICYQLIKENNGNIEITNIKNGTKVSLIFNNKGEM